MAKEGSWENLSKKVVFGEWDFVHCGWGMGWSKCVLREETEKVQQIVIETVTA